MNLSDFYKIFRNSNGVNTDTRSLKKGQIFFALKGEKFDGNRFVKQAFEKGASFAVISDKNEFVEGKTWLVDDTLKTLQELAKFHRNNLNIRVFGITGTNGKTTTKELVYRVLAKKFKASATQGNLNNHIGVPLTILNLPKDSEYAIIEMGANHPGEIAELCEISQPTSGLITNIGYAHLEGFGTLENLINTKLALFEAVKNNGGTYFLNADDPILTEKIKNYDKIFKYGNCHDCLVKPVKIENNLFLKMQVKIKGEIYEVETQLVGKYNWQNVLAAISVGIANEIEVDAILRAIRDFAPSNNRSQLFKTDNNTLILDMYNANPTSMKLAIENFAQMNADNKILLIGDMLELGNDEILEHQKIIDFALQQNFEKIILVGKRFGQCKYPADIQWFENVWQLNDFLEKYPVKNHTILLKASNGTGLKNCVQYL